MGFNNFARKVRDTSLPHGHRYVSLRSCVQLYRPIGFHATVGYLEAKAGPFRRDETALLRALEVIETSRALWQADVRSYAASRAEAKRLGMRTPRPADPNPLVPAYWYGARREAALYALEHWRRGPGRGEYAYGDSERRFLDRLAAVGIETGGDLGADGRRALAACVEALEEHLRKPVRGGDTLTRMRLRELLFVARLLRSADSG